MACLSNVGGVARPRLIESGWVCDGSNLVTVIDATATMPPCVIRSDLLPYVDDAFLGFLPAREFAGGDHWHVVISVPLRTPREQS